MSSSDDWDGSGSEENMLMQGYILCRATSREVVLAAVAQNGEALLYASDELRADREVVLAAVAQHG